MKRPQYVFRPNLNEPQHRRAWALLQQVPPAKRKEFLVQAILATEQTDRLEKSIRKVVREELQAVNIRKETFSVKIVRDSAVSQEPAQPQAVSPEENRFSIRPRQIALFFLWMLAFTLLARGTSGALLPEVQLSTPAPNTITQSLTATGTIQWAAGSLFYLPEGLLVEAVFVSEGEAVQEGDKIAALRREDVEQMPNSEMRG